MIERSSARARRLCKSGRPPDESCRNALQFRGFRLAWAAFGALLLALASAPTGALAGDEMARLEEELRRQQELLSQMEAGEMPTTEQPDERERAEFVDAGDPRVAPAAPVDRELPLAIFDTRKVRIREGAWGNDRPLDVEQRVLDADGDGTPELVRYVDPKSNYVIRQESDTNFDGVTDTWIDYEWGEPVARVVDSNDDGNPDLWERYENGRAVSREVDRDDDGVRDAFYRYEDGLLVAERHDTNNDGRIDLDITLRNRLRVRAEEDHDKDGRVDTWITYSILDDDEIVSRIERDQKGRGFADTFETFEPIDGKAAISRRDEDVNGDREIDIRSIYRGGKLIRKEIHNPEVVDQL